MSINRRRLLALCHKESLQIVRDPSSILIAFIMPVVLLVVMGYAINLDVDLAQRRRRPGGTAGADPARLYRPRDPRRPEQGGAAGEPGARRDPRPAGDR